MSLTLEKGQRIDLTKGNPNLTKLKVGLGWDVNKIGETAFDLDAVAFLLKDGKLTKSDDVVFYNHLKHSSDSVIHSGDNLTGQGEGDDEVISIDLTKVPTDIQKLLFSVIIFKAKERKQNFSMVENSFIRIVDDSTNIELIKFNLGEDFSTETSVIAGEVYRAGTEWKFGALGIGFKGELADLSKQYGL